MYRGSFLYQRLCVQVRFLRAYVIPIYGLTYVGVNGRIAEGIRFGRVQRIMDRCSDSRADQSICRQLRFDRFLITRRDVTAYGICSAIFRITSAATAAGAAVKGLIAEDYVMIFRERVVG